MTAAMGAGTLFAMGVIGLLAGVRRRRVSLDGLLSQLSGTGEMRATVHGRAVATRTCALTGEHDGVATERRRVDQRIGARIARDITERHHHDMASFQGKIALVGTTLDVLCGQCAVSAVVGFLLPGSAWAMMAAGGLRVPFVVPIWIGIVTGVVGVAFPVLAFEAQVKRARRQATRIICSFLDLLVLGLAAGMGIESALMTAAQTGETELSARILLALGASRETGEPPWEALHQLGERLGLEELCELASTAGMSGTEGAKVRDTLTARAASLRRHELAVVEAEANSVTDKLFLPGAFLLLGFLVFIGYPAFTRIASGF